MNAGLKEGVALAGSPLTLSETLPIKPVPAVTVAVKDVLLPCATVCEAGEADRGARNWVGVTSNWLPIAHSVLGYSAPQVGNSDGHYRPDDLVHGANRRRSLHSQPHRPELLPRCQRHLQPLSSLASLRSVQ
jgi:hypothetical protein